MGLIICRGYWTCYDFIDFFCTYDKMKKIEGGKYVCIFKRSF